MKLFKQTTRLLAAAALVALPLATLAADEKKEEPDLMQPVKLVLDHYLTIQTELAKDSIKGLDEHANAIVGATLSRLVRRANASPTTLRGSARCSEQNPRTARGRLVF